jgi:UDP-N-acetylmuramoyl-L-alanyl-D-glutamate--2,6-diaminopimelate ligase
MNGVSSTKPVRLLDGVLAGMADVPALVVRDLVLDSRTVSPGDGFLALQGRTTHGVDHVGEAIERGAIAVLWDPSDGRQLPPVAGTVASIAVRDLAANLGCIADRFYGQPSAEATVTAVTGTNGKTTCAWLLSQCHGSSGAYIGTLGIGRPGDVAEGTHTTPDVVTLHRSLRALVDDGVRNVAVEASSHALDQDRLAGVRIPIAGFTNLTRDHLDYHGTMAAYGAAKEKLFHRAELRHAVLNFHDEFAAALGNRLRKEVLVTPVCATSENPGTGSYVMCRQVACHEHGLHIDGVTHLGSFNLNSRLLGSFNAENLLLVLGLLLAEEMPLADAIEALSVAVAPPGRMEAFRFTKTGPTLVVDYAHTPDALTKALSALRSHARGSLWCVFGCGGDRDTGKRPMMAAAAERSADRIVITDDNPRTEDPDVIVSAILGGLSGKVPSYVERDRAQAIAWAAAEAGPEDVILIAGKGHEDYQIYGRERRQFSDRKIAQDIVRCAA